MVCGTGIQRCIRAFKSGLQFFWYLGIGFVERAYTVVTDQNDRRTFLTTRSDTNRREHKCERILRGLAAEFTLFAARPRSIRIVRLQSK